MTVGLAELLTTSRDNVSDSNRQLVDGHQLLKDSKVVQLEGKQYAIKILNLYCVL